MGFDIWISKFIIRDGEAVKIYNSEDELYLSYNWSDSSEFNGEHLWYIKDDMSGKSAEVVLERLSKALKTLSEAGIEPGVPDINNSNWGFGTRNTGKTITCGKFSMPETERLPAKERLGVFAYHLKQFEAVAKKWPGYHFLDDCHYDSIEVDGVKYPISKEEVESDDEEEETNEGVITYFRHPVNGTMKIDTFAKCMEIYGLCKYRNSPDAQGWYDLAFKMKDAPK